MMSKDKDIKRVEIRKGSNCFLEITPDQSVELIEMVKPDDLPLVEKTTVDVDNARIVRNAAETYIVDWSSPTGVVRSDAFTQADFEYVVEQLMAGKK